MCVFVLLCVCVFVHVLVYVLVCVCVIVSYFMYSSSVCCKLCFFYLNIIYSFALRLAGADGALEHIEANAAKFTFVGLLSFTDPPRDDSKVLTY